MKIFVSIFIVILIILAVYFSYVLFWPLSSLQDQSQSVTIKIRLGTSFNKIVTILLDSNVICHEKEFIFTAKLFRKTNQLKAGKYQFYKNTSNYNVLSILSEGKFAAERVTIPEGVDARRIASILQRIVEIDSITFINLVHDSTTIHEYNINAHSLEGYLYPDTYQFPWGMSERQILHSMIAEFNKQVPDSLHSRAHEMGFSFNEILTLASIIEGEAVLDDERNIISAVYHNRLRRGMRLQADPTIQYLIADSPRRLLNRDLEIDSPYNTYLYAGLPPGPISNPGIKSIYAALYPADVPYLYFVARGDGGHVFSTTLAQHNRAKVEFDKIRKQVARESKIKHNAKS